MRINVKAMTKRALGIFMMTVMILSATFSGIGSGFLGIDPQGVYAKAVGQKNDEQYKAVNRVATGSTPAGYEDVNNNDKSVMRGGDAVSATNNASIDNGPNTFADVLPYGDIYIDESKLTFANADVDIKDRTNFTWIANNPNNHYSDAYDKMGYDGIKVAREANIGTAASFLHWMEGSIAYIGGLEAYLKDTPEYAAWVAAGSDTSNYSYLKNTVTDSGYTNKITTANTSYPYLYRFTFPGAATLPDGTSGNLVITTTAVEIESATKVDAGKPIGIQSPNNIGICAVFTDFDGKIVQKNKPFIPYNVTVDGVDYLNSFGLKLTFDIKVTDSNNKEVAGNISYATRDLDMTSKQSLWGRQSSSKTDPNSYMYAEGLTINKGSRSYAVVPDFPNSTATNKNTNPQLQFLSGDKKGTGPADGVKFVSTQYLNKRDTSNFLQSGTGEPRNDGNTFDTGFAVLLDANGTTMTWSGSHWSNGQMNTKLFDTSLYTRVEQSHGTGGGIYLEGYEYNNKGTVEATKKENLVIMTQGTDATVTVVPEDGYRVKNIRIGGKNLANPTNYFLVYDASGNVTGIKKGENGTPQALTNNKVTIDGIEFEVNNDGSVDVTLPDVTDIKHVHADFDADYYFYKV